MAHSRFNPAEFWENKILSWEQGRYKPDETEQSVLENIANKSSNSLRFRLTVASAILLPYVKGKTVVEYGCGSGLLAVDFLKAGASRYVGIDFAPTAIENAKAATAESGYSADQLTFRVAEVSEPLGFKPDLVFSLGLLDWLTDAQITIMFQQSGTGTDFLHAISERRWSLQRLLHVLYVQVSYGYRTGSYRPKYHTISQIRELSGVDAGQPLNVFRDPRLSFGALVTTLDIPEPLGV